MNFIPALLIVPQFTNDDMFDVLLLLPTCVALFTIVTAMFMRRKSAFSFLECQRGSAYMLSLVIILPFFTLLICTITECGLMMVTKLELGTARS